MTFREYLRYRIPINEIIVAHYGQLVGLQAKAAKVGVIVCHGMEYYYNANYIDYCGDDSYPPDDTSCVPAIPENFRALFVVNCTSDNTRITALPKGTNLHRFPWRIAVAGLGAHRSKLAYCNFSLGAPDQPAYTAHRNTVYELLKERDWITFAGMGYTFNKHKMTSLQFFRQISQHRFTISPEGNGVDCFRTWEALYLKSIPIVQESREMEHFRDLPILFTRDYSELTPEYLEDQYDRMMETEYNIEKLHVSYWKNLIQAEVDRQRAEQ